MAALEIGCYRGHPRLHLLQVVRRLLPRVRPLLSFSVEDVRKDDLDLALGTLRRVATVAGVVHVVVRVAEEPPYRLPRQGPSLRNSGRAQDVSPELDPVLPGQAESDDVTAGHVVDQVVEVRLAAVLSVESLRDLKAAGLKNLFNPPSTTASNNLKEFKN